MINKGSWTYEPKPKAEKIQSAIKEIVQSILKEVLEAELEESLEYRRYECSINDNYR